MTDDQLVAALVALTRVDWLVTAVHKTGDRSYPFQVEGRNLNVQIGQHGDHFSWGVRNLDDPRYLFTNPHIALACKQVVDPLLAAFNKRNDPLLDMRGFDALVEADAART